MRQSALLVAAVLAFAMLVPRTALAFEFDSAGSTNPDGTAKFADPDENLNLSTPKVDAGTTKSTDTPPNSTMLLPGLYLSGSANGNAGLGQTEGWMNPQPGRLTH
jgi:hypothetical protein